MTALRPDVVALVHGDADARGALAQRLEHLATVVQPRDGQTLRGPWRSAAGKHKRNQAQTQTITILPVKLGDGSSLDTTGLERLWEAFVDADAETASVRELAHAWYGATGDEEEAAVVTLLATSQPFFSSLAELPGVYRLRTRDADGIALDTPPPLVGQVVILQTMPEQVLPAVILEAGPNGLSAVLPHGEGGRSRFSLVAVREIVASWPDARDDRSLVARVLAEHVKATRRWRWQYGAYRLAEAMDDGVAYDLDQLATLVGIEPGDLMGRLALALTATRYGELFVRSQGPWGVGAGSQYTRHPEWQAAVAAGVGKVRPDQSWMLAIVDQHLGQPEDLYRRSVDADSGAVSLYFHFPAIAQTHYAAALAAIRTDAGVEVTLIPQPHQGALADAAVAVLPPGIGAVRTPALYHDRQTVVVRTSTSLAPDELAAATAHFAETTGWQLAIETTQGQNASTWQGAASAERMEVNAAIALARASLGPETGCYKVGADAVSGTLVLRFYFPDIAHERAAHQIAAIAERTGWNVSVYDQPHQAALVDQVRQVLPDGLSMIGQPSLWREVRSLTASYRGEADTEALAAAEDAFAQTTGWTLVLRRA